MDPNRPDRILDEWTAVAHTARRPATAPRRAILRSALPGVSVAGALMAVAAVVVAVVWLGGPRPDGGVGAVPTATATPPASSAAPTSQATEPPPSSVPTPAASTAPTATAEPTIGPCDPAGLSARITGWEGAAGHRIATVTITHSGSTSCTVPALWRPQLTDAGGSVLIDGTAPVSSETVTVATGAVLTTLVDTSDYCGAAPTAPVTVTFTRADVPGAVVAAPLSPTDATVPPCLGSPGSAGVIQMHPWAP